MDETESQIAKILLGNTKSSSSYTYVLAEKAADRLSELYVVAELPLFNPAAQEEYERICLAISAALKRCYRVPADSSTFENAVNLVNEELGKLASMGQAERIGKLNCILAVRHGNSFDIATCGKISAFLLRNKEYTDISCSEERSHPLKAFENFASGKIRLGDLLILSTTQLFNHISMDRLLNIVSNADFLTATQTVIELLKENADPQTSFGVLMNLQIAPGQATDEEIDLENYLIEQPAPQPNLGEKILAWAKHVFDLKKTSRKPQTSLPKVSAPVPATSLKEKFQLTVSGTKRLAEKSRSFWRATKVFSKNTGAAAARAGTNIKNFKTLSTSKKFLFISVAVLLAAVVLNIGIAVHLKNSRKAGAEILSRLQETQSLLSQAESALLYKSDTQAFDYLKQAIEKMPAEKDVNSANQELYKTVSEKLTSVRQETEKNVDVSTENLGALGQADFLIKLPDYLAVQVGDSILSYSKTTGKIEDGALKLPASALAAVYADKNKAIVYDGSSLKIWDTSTGSLDNDISQNVPSKEAFGGMAYYPTKNRVYIADKTSNTITFFSFNGTRLINPTVYTTNQALNSAQGIAIDGSVYALTKDNINKFFTGTLQDFTLPAMPTSFSGSGKIYTEKDWQYLYLLDSGNNRVLVFDKKGALVYTLNSSGFTKLKDFAVDEANKVIYILNDASLLKINLP